MRLFYFSNNAPNEFKKNLTSSVSKNNKYSLAAKITPYICVALTTILSAIQVSLDNTSRDNKTTIDNTITPIIAATGAVSILLTGVFSYLKTTTESEMTTLINDGVKRHYFDLESTTSRPNNPIMMSSAQPNIEAPTQDNELSEAQHITADGLIRRFTR